jgi:transcriptional regulator with XRE-family HTH domain
MRKTLSERLQYLLPNLNISQREFADKIGFSHSYISLILNGVKKTPSTRFFNAVGREFSVNPIWLRSGLGEIFILPGVSLAPLDTEIIARYKLLSSEDKTTVDKIINALLIKTVNKEQKSKSKE